LLEVEVVVGAVVMCFATSFLAIKMSVSKSALLGVEPTVLNIIDALD
jgi:hypothetical protein